MKIYIAFTILSVCLLYTMLEGKKQTQKKENKIITVLEQDEILDKHIITHQEAQSIMQITSSLLCILQQPHSKQAIIQGVSGMAAGMASLIVHGMNHTKRSISDQESEQLKKQITNYIYKYLIGKLQVEG